MGAVPDVRRTESLREEHLDLLARELPQPVAEQPLGLAVGDDDVARGIGHHDGVGHRFEEIAEALLHQPDVTLHPERSDVLLGHDDALDFTDLVTQHLAGNIDVDERAILAAAGAVEGALAVPQDLGEVTGVFIAAGHRHDQLDHRRTDRLDAGIAKDAFRR